MVICTWMRGFLSVEGRVQWVSDAPAVATRAGRMSEECREEEWALSIWPLHDLRPVAGEVDPDDRDALGAGGGPGGGFELGHLLGRAHVGPDEAAGLPRGVGLVLHAFGEAAFAGFGGHVDDVAVHVEFPAVIEAAEAALLVATEGEGGLAVGAGLAEHAEAAVAVAEGDQVLAEQADADGVAVGTRHLLGQHRGDPVAAHHAAHRRVGLDPAERLVLGVGEHGGCTPSLTAGGGRDRA